MSRPTPWNPLPHLKDGRVDKKEARRIYDTSEHVEWIEFCREKNWHPQNSHKALRPASWVAAKRSTIIENAKSKIQDFTQCHQGRWIDQVTATLTEYPKAIDDVMGLVSKFITENAELKISMSAKEINSLASAVKTCVEAKKSILFLNNLVADVQKAMPTEGEELQKSEWTLKLRGTKEMSVNEIKAAMGSYLDVPADDGGTPDAGT